MTDQKDQISEEPQKSLENEQAEEFYLAEESSEDETNALTNGEMEQFDNMLSDYLDSMSELEIGRIAKAMVIDVQKDFVLLDIGDKAEGIAPASEFTDFDGNVSVKAGDEVEVVVEGRDSGSGQVKVSYRKARHRVEWQRIVEAFENNHPVKGRVVRALKSGVLVDIGLPCFLPGSQIDVHRIEKLDSLVGEVFEVYIVDLDRQRRRGVLSRRKLLLEEQERKKSEKIAALEEDQVVEGKVKNVCQFGVFIDLNGVDGLVPREEVAWERRVNIPEVLKPGETYSFKIINIDRERGRISLSHRQIKDDPWSKIEETYPQNSAIEAKVTNLTNNCAYVTLADGIEGRIHIDNLSWNTGTRKPSDILKKNNEVKAVVLDYDKTRRLLELGVKQLTEDPWANIEERFPLKSKHSVTIAHVADYGVFVKLDEFTRGLIHISDLTHDRSIKKPSELVKKGDTVEAVVLKIDKEGRRINFGMKQLEENPFTAYTKANGVGSVVTATVKEVNKAGIVFDLAKNVEGFLPISQWSRERIETLEGVVKPGEEVQNLKITKIDKKPRKISLSRRAHLQDEERKVVDQFNKTTGTSKATTSLGSLLKGLDIKIK